LQESQADVGHAEAIPEAVSDVVERDNGPPPATVARRAKSYSDFYNVVRAHVKKEKELERKKSQELISTELAFAEWYGDISEELLDASHEEYQYEQHSPHIGGLSGKTVLIYPSESTMSSFI
jgi:hypothetical protein